MSGRTVACCGRVLTTALLCGLLLIGGVQLAPAQERPVTKQDYQIDAVDPGIKLFVRMKAPDGNPQATNYNVVLFIHGATFPSTPDFDLPYKDYSWADRLVRQGYTVYLFDKRNYGFSSREPALNQPAKDAKPVTRSYLAIEGATHGFTPCRTCADDPYANGKSVQNLFDYVAEWAR